MELKIDTTFSLNNGVKIPCLGLGLYRSPSGKKSFQTVLEGIKIGYRHFDTAAVYKNEEDLGRAVRESEIPREKLFITTKLWNEDQGYDQALRAFDVSLKKLGMEYIDLYLIHWPGSGKRHQSWEAMRKLYADGKCRSIGVSNYTIGHLKKLLDESAVIPAVNQVEFHPFLFQKDLSDFCRSQEIQIVGYSPLAKGRRINDPTIVSIAKKHNKTPAQIMIRWLLQKEIVAIPKSNKPERLRENANVFDFVLDTEDVDTLDSLNEDLRTSWDPTEIQ